MAVINMGVEEMGKPSSGRQIDPITTEVIRNALTSAAEEMNSSLIRSAYTPLIYEARDCSVGLFNERGEMLGQAAGLPIFLGNLEEAIKVTTAKYGLDAYEEGDVYIVNDSFLMGTHLGDITIFSPIFFQGDLVGFAASRAHWIDIGASNRGGSVDSTEIFQEGLRLGPTRLVSGGVLVQDIVDILCINSRFPQKITGDMHAQIAACRMGERRFQAILEKYGLKTVRGAAENIFAQSERMDREAVAKIPDGEYYAEGCLDNDGHSDEPVWVRVKVMVEGSDMTIDLTGSSPQVQGNVNCGYAQTVSGCRVAYKMLVNPNASVSGGTFRALHVIVPESSIVAAKEPAACQFYFTPLGLVIDLVAKALAETLPDQVAAAHFGDSMLLFLRRTDFTLNDNNRGGWGADMYQDGESALVNVVCGATRNYPVELLENKFPMDFIRYGLRPDSGGPGRNRGGLGTIREFEIREEGVVTSLWFDRSRTPAWGLFGGQAGSGPEVLFNPSRENELSILKVSVMPVSIGTVASARAGGGGGYGSPLEREPERVREDVIDGYVTVDAAYKHYGVVFFENTFEVDEERTYQERARRWLVQPDNSPLEGN